MRLVGIVVAMLVVLGGAHAGTKANDKAMKPYVGKIVISPDPLPTTLEEIPRYLKMYVQSDGNYEVMKGPPWAINLIAVLTKDPGKKPITLVFADKSDKKLSAFHTVEVPTKRNIVLAKVEVTVAAGFASGKTYVMRVMLGKTVLASCDVTLRY